LTENTPIKDPFFTSFEEDFDRNLLPTKFELMLNNEPHALCLLAANKLQDYLKQQDDWQHNFGLEKVQGGAIIGKMFGVLVVKTAQNDIGYLSAFSGKLAGSNIHKKFVPPIFDLLTHNSFLNKGMIELTRINDEIKSLETLAIPDNLDQINALKILRKNNSVALQLQIFNQYVFINKAKEEKSIYTLFKNASYRNPPSGAGECAGPKLLQYAFKNNMEPLAITEFWWGLSPKSKLWKHGHFYACCVEKCEPILLHMLAGINN
jgi:tRNA pseudouridine32 synthase/23S rRNA pseudouridine746 synthase